MNLAAGRTHPPRSRRWWWVAGSRIPRRRGDQHRLPHDQIERQKDDAKKERAQPPHNPIHAALIRILRHKQGENEDDHKSEEKVVHRPPFSASYSPPSSL